MKKENIARFKKYVVQQNLKKNLKLLKLFPVSVPKEQRTTE